MVPIMSLWMPILLSAVVGSNYYFVDLTSELQEEIIKRTEQMSY